jgi:diguanylate cyclase (GGDEF)-like protein
MIDATLNTKHTQQVSRTNQNYIPGATWMLAVYYRIDIAVFAITFMSIFLLTARKRLDPNSLSNRLLILLMFCSTLLNLFEILGWIFEGQPGISMFWLNRIGNTLLYLGTPVPPVVWLLYVHSLIFQNKKGLIRLFYASSAFLLVNAVGTLLSWQTGWFFSISPANAYSRGPYLWIHASIVYMMLLLNLVVILVHRRRLEQRIFRLLLAYYILPIIGSAVQLSFYGVALTWPLTALSSMLIYLHIQDYQLMTDHLTGIYNRRHFERMIAWRMRQGALEGGFSVIALDVDQFKQINDRFGHDAGDKALKQVVQILKKCLRQQDAVARMGGDEFYIIIQTNQQDALDRAVTRIRDAFAQFNQTSGEPYQLQISLGTVLYEPKRDVTAEVLLKQADRRMYEEKIKTRMQAETQKTSQENG